jgi:hypothetical protein
VRRKSCSLSEGGATFGLDGLDLLEEGLVLAVDLDVADFLEGDLLGTLIQELEAFGPLLADAALEEAQLGLVDLPGTLHLLVEAQLVAHWDRSKHSVSDMEKIWNHLSSTNKREHHPRKRSLLQA